MVSAERSGIPPVEARNLGPGPSINQDKPERGRCKLWRNASLFRETAGARRITDRACA